MAQIRGATTVLAAMVESHATTEEELLFTALEPHLGRDVGPIAQMCAEHEELERLLGQIEEAQDVAEATALVAKALSAARSHFRKEEQILYPHGPEFIG
jgi:iron-sulfur cluster repair protein YtfE (RIC family)